MVEWSSAVGAQAVDKAKADVTTADVEDVLVVTASQSEELHPACEFAFWIYTFIFDDFWKIDG